MKPPRRAFATPFVVTIGLAGCTRQETPSPPITTMARDAAVVAVAPPVDAAEPTTVDAAEHQDVVKNLFEPPPAGVTTWTVTMYANKTCSLQYNMYCPPAASCNPPQPRSYACPAGMTADRKAFITHKAGNPECTLDFETKCGAEIGSCTKGPSSRKIKCPG